MKCFYHPAVDSVQGCRACGKWLCPACAHSIKGNFYCQDCLVKGAELAVVAGSSTIPNDWPGKALVFAFIPGMGAVFNRQYTKGLVHFSIFAALFLLADRAHGVFGLAALAFWVFQILDAYRSAQTLLRLRLSQPGWSEDQEQETINAPVWGFILMGVGLLFLVDNLVDADLFAFVDKLWPLAFVGLGGYLIWDYSQRRKIPPSPGGLETGHSFSDYPTSKGPEPL